MSKRARLGKKEKTMGAMKKKIFILHGWTKKIDQWKPFVEYLKEDRFSVTLLKVPGLTAKTDKPWTLDDYVEWLKNILYKQKDKVILIGHSNGGRIALAFAQKYQEKLDTLVLIDSAGITQNQVPLTTKRLAFKLIAKIGKRITSSVKLKNLLYKLAGEIDYKNSDELMKKTMVNLISVNLKPALSKITCPTVIIWGEHDRIIPLSDGKFINEIIKHSKLYIIKEARHSPQYTHPEIVADRILGELI